MTDQSNLENKLHALLDHWEEFTRDELRHVSAAGVLTELRYLLPPAPLPDPLFGAQATHPEHGEGIVVSHFPSEGGSVGFMFRADGSADGTSYRWVFPSTLTFHTPDHPVFLETEEEYRNAPGGTIVVNDNDEPPAVLMDGLWRHAGPWTLYHEEMTGVRRRVLRWGRKA